VQAYSAETGQFLWADYHDKQEVNDIVAQDERVIAVGSRQGGPAVVRAYDVKSGDILWRVSYGGSFSEAMAVSTNGQLAYVGGRVRSTTAEPSIWMVRAVDLTTGARVWQDRFKTAKVGGRVNDLVVVSGRVYAVGLTEDAVLRAAKDFFIRVYDAQ
jgi:outer membrane protein assembly factor BamB